MLTLGFGLAFTDLYDRSGLEKIDRAFLAELTASDAGLCTRLTAARADPAAVDAKTESELLIALAPHVDDFIGTLFPIADDVRALVKAHHELAPLFEIKRQFVQRKAAKALDAGTAASLDGERLGIELQSLVGASVGNVAAFELAFAEHVTRWQADEPASAASLDLALRYAAWALASDVGRRRHRKGVLFKMPEKVDPLHLLDHAVDRHENWHDSGVTAFTIKPASLRRRAGFALTDHGTNLTGALDQANYCSTRTGRSCRLSPRQTSCSRRPHTSSWPCGVAR
jgi:hypothetical protein